LTLSRSAWGAEPLVTSKLDDNFIEITGAGSNVLVRMSPDGVLMIDCGLAERSAELLKVVAKQCGNRPVQVLFNTHWHLESTGANDAMAKAGAKIVSHVNTKLWMTQEIVHDWEEKIFPPRAKEALPTETFYTTGKTTFGGELIEYGLMPMAHTDGDIYVHFKQSNVLVAGDAVQPGRLPLLDWFTGGWIGGMQEAHRTLLSLANDTTKIVPATGPVMTKAELQKSLDLITKVREKLVELVKRQGMGPEDLIEAKAVQEFADRLSGDPKTFLYTAYRGIYAHARELGGVL
jgi:glyoxylase-like metal-dependent hydrolase (beta-lactamase superfamily II)